MSRETCDINFGRRDESDALGLGSCAAIEYIKASSSTHDQQILIQRMESEDTFKNAIHKE